MEHQNLTDEKLVKMFLECRKEEFFVEIVNRYGDKVYRLAHRVTRDPSNAEDVLQEVFLTLVRKLYTFRGKSTFSSWLYRVTENVIFMHLRTEEKYESNLSIEDYVLYDKNGTFQGTRVNGWIDRPDTALFRKETIIIVEKAVNELPEPYRAVFHLSDIEGFSNKEVARVLDLSIPAVKSRLHRARLLLRDKLSDYFFEFKRNKKPAI